MKRFLVLAVSGLLALMLTACEDKSEKKVDATADTAVESTVNKEGMDTSAAPAEAAPEAAAPAEAAPEAAAPAEAAPEAAAAPAEEKKDDAEAAPAAAE